MEQLIASGGLKGKTIEEAKKIIAFGSKQDDRENVDVKSGYTYLAIDVSRPGELSGTDFNVTIEKGKVIGEALVGD